ncbi:hypothetical protein EDD85DRAFT_554778 [Armillaria nabsnona]|nr:hypothetical protein EDD85DRAFT_554778 [Armillaria nabsnona]
MNGGQKRLRERRGWMSYCAVRGSLIDSPKDRHHISRPWNVRHLTSRSDLHLILTLIAFQYPVRGFMDAPSKLVPRRYRLTHPHSCWTSLWVSGRNARFLVRCVDGPVLSIRRGTERPRAEQIGRGNGWCTLRSVPGVLGRGIQWALYLFVISAILGVQLGRSIILSSTFPARARRRGWIL